MKIILKSLSIALACVFAAGHAQANGTLPTVVAGQASFVTRGSSLNITNTPGTIINWQGFSIGAGEATRFIQQNSASSVLNRVTGSDPSSILGMFTSNGRVFLINPNGILVGLGARIDMVELVASALNMNNQDFRAGRLNFTPNSLAGKVENQGSITTPSGGKVYLVGATVINSGIINSPNGEVILAAGKSVKIFDSSTPGVRVEITAGNNTSVNLGEILAQSGEVGIYGAALQNSGIISADQVGLDATGKIVLRATQDVTLEAGSRISANGEHGGEITIQSESGTTLMSGTIDASSTGVGKTGGTVQALGNKVGLLGGHINASGEAGGGTVLIGGDLHGANPAIQNASAAYMSADSTISADAITKGSGGKVVLWSNDSTRAYGSITAHGGMHGGNGGMIETSGHWLDVAGINVNASAPSGKSGRWLLDPADVTIGIPGSTNIGGSYNGGTPEDIFSPFPGGAAANVDAGILQGILNGGTDVTITTTNNGLAGGGIGDITVNAALTWTTAQTLKLLAANDVKINYAMTATSATGGSGIVLTAVRDVLINAAITASSDNSAIKLTAGRDVIAGFAITASAVNTVINMSAGNNVTSTSAVTATGSGDKIDMIAGGNGSVTVNTVTASGGGSINLRANKDVIVNGVITADTAFVSGTSPVILISDNDGTGPGVAGGTVIFTGAGAQVVTPKTTICFNPVDYSHTVSEIAAYGTNVSAPATLDAKAWVFAQGTDKVYNGIADRTVTVNSLKPDLSSNASGASLTTVGVLFDGTGDVGTNKPITFTSYTLTDATNNYALFAPFGATAGTGTATANITPASLSVTAIAQTMTYGDLTLPTLTYTNGPLASGDSTSLISGALITTATLYNGTAGSGSNSGIYAINQGSLNAGNNYTISYTPANLTVNTALLKVTANSVGKTYDGLAYSGGGVSYSGFVNGDGTGNLSGTLAYTGNSQGATNANPYVPYVITPSGLISGNYVISFVNGALTVSPALLTVTAGDAIKVYGQTPVLSLFTYTGQQNGETVTSVTETSLGTPSTASVASSPYAITITPGSGVGTFLPSNYNIVYIPGTLAVTPALLTLTANDANKTYGQTATLLPTAFTPVGLVNGDTVGSVTETSPGTLATASVAGSSYAITPSLATGGTFDPVNYTIGYVNGALTVTPASLTVTAVSATKTYGQTPALTLFTYTGQQNGDTVGSVTEFSTGSAGTASVVGGPYAITPSAATGGTFTPSNYTLTYVDGTLTVTPASLTVTASNATKTYGQTPALSAFTYTGQQNGETVGSVTETSSGTLANASVAGSAYAITPSAATGGTFTPSNYTIGYVDGALTVTPASLTVTAVNATKIYGQTPALSAFTYAGQQNGDTVGSVTEFSTGAVATASVVGGPYAIAPSAATGGTFTPSNYTISYVNGALTVNTAPLTVTASNVTKIYGQTPALSAFTYAGQQNGDTVGSVTEFSTGAVATASVVGGPYAIAPSAATGGTFTPSNYTISYVNGALTVNTAPLTVTASNATKIYGQTPALTLFTYTGQQNGETVGTVTETSSGTLANASVAGSAYAIAPSAATGGTFDPANYTLTYVNGALTVTPASLTVTASNATKTYGQTPALTLFTYTGQQNGDTVGSVTEFSTGAAGTASAVGSPYAITPSTATGGTFTPSNYTISYVNGALTVNTAPLTVTASNAAKTYGQSPVLSAFTYTGQQNGETIGSVTEFSTGAAGTASVVGGPYAITPSAAIGGTFTPSNYTISYVNGALTVTPAALSVTANPAGKTYNGFAYSGGNGVSYSGFVNGEGTGVLGGTLVYSGNSQGAVNAGGYLITPSGLTSANYIISDFNGVLTVSKAALFVTANSAAKPYDGLAYSGGNGVIYNGFVNGEGAGVLGGTLSYSGNSQGAVNAGGYLITPSGLTSTNYNISDFSGVLTVGKISLSVTANSFVKTYDGLAYSGGNGVVYSGFVNSETAGVLGGILVYGGSSQHVVNAGSYIITPGGLTSTNYNISNFNGALTVNPAPLSVIANASVKTYDGLVYSGGNGVSYSGFVNGETSAVLGGTLAYSGTSQTALNVGGYVISPGGLNSTNYNISFFDNALTVNPALLIVTASAASRMFGAANPMFTFTLSGFVNGETAASAGVTGTATLDSLATSNTPAGPATITAGAGSLAAGNYVFTHLVSGTLTINPVAQAVTPPAYLVNGTTIVSSMPMPDYNGNSHCVIDADNYIFKTKTVARENICSPVRIIRLIEVNKKEEESPATNLLLADNSSTGILPDAGGVNFLEKTISIDKTIDTGENVKPASNRDCGKAPVHTFVHAKPHHPKVIYQQAVVRNPFSHTRPSIKHKASKRLTCIDGIYVETK